MRPDQQATKDLEGALEQCHRAAKKGHQLAFKSLEKSSGALKDAERSLRESLDSFDQADLESQETTVRLREQLAEVMSGLRGVQSETEQRLQQHANHLAQFSITLFGRTMAGKSTLMEILTRGNGESIGKGAQRTTRDVRTYRWRGLDITDVPGIAAFEGQGDAQVAFASAEKADLVLFLITDDAPQPVEAEHLVNVRRLGKPVLGVCNVKVGIDDPRSLKRFLRDPESHFDPRRLGDIERQFMDFIYAEAPEVRVRFQPVHLRSRFLSDHPEFSEHRDALRRSSRFDQVEERICREVAGRGAMLRVRTFLDCAAVPAVRLADRLFEFSAANSSAGRLLIGKGREFDSWTDRFVRESLEQIDTGVHSWVDGLRARVPGFVEANLESTQLKDKWEKVIRDACLDRKAEGLQKSLHELATGRLRDLVREIKVGMDLAADLGVPGVRAASITDTKRIWNWGVTIVSGGLGIAALILASGPLGWAAAGVGLVGALFSWLFDDREAKERRARTRLERKLNDHLWGIEKELRGSLKQWFHAGLLSGIRKVRSDLRLVTNALFSLADAQRGLAGELNSRAKELSRSLVEEAAKHVGAEEIVSGIRDVARVPGMGAMLLIPPELKFPGGLRADLEQQLDEPVWFVIDNGDRESMIAQAIGRGCTRRGVRIESKVGQVHVRCDRPEELNAERIRMAQQLSGLQVLVEPWSQTSNSRQEVGEA